MKNIYTLFKIIAGLIGGAFGLFALGCVIGLVVAIKEGRVSEAVICLILGCISGGIGILFSLLSEKFEDMAYDADHKSTTSYSNSQSSSSGSWYSGESFSASDYVRTHCRGQNYGVLLPDELEKIENDSSLTTVQKEKAKEEYKWQVGTNNLSGSGTPWR